MTPTLAPAADEPHVAPPGDLAIWFFILAELLAFAVFFAAYAFARAKNPALFDEMQLTLNRDAGAVNTLLLISASWCVARGVHAVVANNDSARASRWLLGGLAGGAGFLVVKLFEYAHVFGEGITLSTNTFYMFYISLTFFHFMHVILGMVILTVLWAQTRKGLYTPTSANGLESGAAYWHMVDLVWIVLFPLVYVMR
ncbi:cytochrome c oxidase subunit 3 [Denitromonas sp.]|uniref:cytochrome c oxidase subunit 3 n=1 Tax=Denitromonas sp. TaxID=2734609 RepID=UPI003A8B0AEB